MGVITRWQVRNHAAGIGVRQKPVSVLVWASSDAVADDEEEEEQKKGLRRMRRTRRRRMMRDDNM